MKTLFEYYRNIMLVTFTYAGFCMCYNYGFNSFYTNQYIDDINYCFMVYILLDIALMLCFRSLFRQDLLLHHIIVFITYYRYLNIGPLQLTNYLMCESISCMNVLLSKNQLALYRKYIIYFVRMPIWCIYLYRVNFIEDYSVISDKISQYGFRYLQVFFIFYDIYLLKRLIN